MRQAIVTKFHGPTDRRGYRVSAKADAGRVSLSWSHSKGIEWNHAAAARALAEKLGWIGKWVGGGLPGSGFVFVLIAGDERDDRDGFTVKAEG